MRPALLRNLRRIALGDCPGTWRVHDESAAAGYKPLVVGGVVPGRRILGIELRQLHAVLERLADRIGLHRDVALGVDEVCAMGEEEGTGRIDRVGRLPKPNPERTPALLPAFDP